MFPPVHLGNYEVYSLHCSRKFIEEPSILGLFAPCHPQKGPQMVLGNSQHSRVVPIAAGEYHAGFTLID